MALKTYLIAPNFTFEPDGPIQIGRIIANPFRPTKSLHTPSEPPNTSTHTDFDNTYSKGNSYSVHGSVWAQFLQTVSANVGGGVDKDALTQYTMDSLETVRMKEDPTDQEAVILAKLPNVHAAMRWGLSGMAPVYMITGVKIAKGFRLNKSISRNIEAQVGASVPITEEIGAGAEMSVSRGNTAEETARSGSDIVFAYQLHVIASKRWWSRKVAADIYAPSAAFLGKDDDAVVEEMISGHVSKELLQEVAEENEDDVGMREMQEGDEHSVCVFLK